MRPSAAIGSRLCDHRDRSRGATSRFPLHRSFPREERELRREEVVDTETSRTHYSEEQCSEAERGDEFEAAVGHVHAVTDVNDDERACHDGEQQGTEDGDQQTEDQRDTAEDLDPGRDECAQEGAGTPIPSNAAAVPDWPHTVSF